MVEEMILYSRDTEETTLQLVDAGAERMVSNESLSLFDHNRLNSDTAQEEISYSDIDGFERYRYALVDGSDDEKD